VEVQSIETPNLDRALAALAWASSVAHLEKTADLPTDRPERPTPAELRAVPVDVLRRELDHLLVGRRPDDGLDALLDMGVLDAWLPEVAVMVGFGDGEWRHKDVWKHTKQVVKQAVPRIAVRWGALLHDIGKPRTRTISPNGEVHFHGHAELGAAMFRKRVGARLGFDQQLFGQIHDLILHHLRAAQYDRDWTDSAVRRFAKEMGEGLTDLLDLSRADITTKRPEKRKRGVQQISDLAQRVREIEEFDAKKPPLPKGVGQWIMESFGLPPSKRIGDIKKMLECSVEDGELEGGRDSAYYIEWITERRERFGL
jgi:poly(A) polymerase